MMAENSDRPALRLRWDVFLNFRGEDTRHLFTIPLYRELEKHGVRAFFDDEGLRQGDSLDPILYEAIRESGASVVIISPNYASSRWCLEELAAISECRRLVLPVFYGVDPSDVRRQRGPFEGHFRRHEDKFGVEMVEKWRKAMVFVGNLKGRVFDPSSWEPISLIRGLVDDILSELKNTPMFVAPYIVGLDFRMEELMRLLDPRSEGVIVLGLHGIGGVGKTTLAKALFNKLVGHFERRSFISNVREMSTRQDGLASLKRKLVEDLSGAKDGKLPEKPVLVVLDDVDHINQLHTLARKRDWFYEGSRIIISTRDRQVLLPQLVNETYEVRELGFSDSLELFSYHAFRMKKPLEKFSRLSDEIVSLTGKLPLALEVFGSLLYDKRSLEKWEDTFKLLTKVRPGHLQDVLKISYDGLDEQEKCVFLDIACLLLELEMSNADAIDLLEGSGFGAINAIDILIQRSLLKVRENNELWMHDQIRDMGMQIVWGENRLDAGNRSRLWERHEILGVLQDRKGTERVEGIVLDLGSMKFPSNRLITAQTIASNNIRRGRLNLDSLATYLGEKCKRCWKKYNSEEKEENVLHTESFQPMKNLRFLHLGNVKLEGDFRNLPSNLRCLQWKNCPLKDYPSPCPRELSVLDLPGSKIETLWGSSRWWHWHKYNSKAAENLTILNLYGCYNLRSIPIPSRSTALKKLNLESCKSLTMIHRSIKNLTTLHSLNLKDCSSLGELPNDISGLKTLKSLNLSGCLKIKELPESIRNIFSLRELFLDKTAVSKLPESIIRLTKLERLNLCSCKSLTRLPVGIGNLVSLKELLLDDSAVETVPESIGLLKNLYELSLRRCTSLTAIPDSIGNLMLLRNFWLNGTPAPELPASVGSIHYLKALSLAQCSRIGVLPVSIGGLSSIISLQLDGTSIKGLPDQIEGLKSLQMLEMRNCESFVSFPDTMGKLLALETLIIENAAITELPESIGKLEYLIMLNLNKNRLLHRLPASIGKLKSLHHLHAEKTAISELPNSFGKLSNLRILKMGKTPLRNQNFPQTPITLPSSFYDLSLLQDLDVKAWRISGHLSNDFQNLMSLEMLNLAHNNFCSLPSSLRGLTLLKELSLEHCELLEVLPSLPSSLVKLNAADCTLLKSVTDISNLESLKELNLTNCERLERINGLECLRSLRWLYMFGCNACTTDVRGKLNKVALRNLHHLSMPGRGVPDWFTHDMISCSIPRNHVIKAVIIIVVISVNHQIEEFRNQLPVTPGVEARILRLGKQVFGTMLYLPGVPNTYQDQVYLCRYPVYHPLVSILRDGDEIQVAMQSPPPVQGVELKESGIHLVFENDDDLDGNEELLDETNKSVSERLTRYINSPEEHNVVSQEEAEQRNHDRVCCSSLLAFLFRF